MGKTCSEPLSCILFPSGRFFSENSLSFLFSKLLCSSSQGDRRVPWMTRILHFIDWRRNLSQRLCLKRSLPSPTCSVPAVVASLAQETFDPYIRTHSLHHHKAQAKLKVSYPFALRKCAIFCPQSCTPTVLSDTL